MSNPTHEDLLRFFDYRVKLTLLKGYSEHNTGKDDKEKYKIAKTPIPASTGNVRTLTMDVVKEGDVDHLLREYSGIWIGLHIPDGYILVDIDNKATGKAVEETMAAVGVRCIGIETPNGYQFIFKDSGKVKSQKVKFMTMLGCPVDYRLSGKGYIVMPTANTENRRLLRIPDAADMMPSYFIPVRQLKKDEENVIPLPIHDGERHGTMISHVARVRQWVGKYKLDVDYREVCGEINRDFVSPPLEPHEMEEMFKSADKLPAPQPVMANRTDESVGLQELCGLQYAPDMPFSFEVRDNQLIHLNERTGSFVEICQAFAIASTIKPEGSKDDLGFIVRDCYGNEAVMSMNISERKTFEAEITAFTARPLNGVRMALLQEYIAEFYKDNHNRLPVRVGMSRTGWHDGKFYIPTRDHEEVSWVDNNLVTAFTCSGEAEGQLKMLKAVLKTPASIIPLCALAAVLIKPFNLTNLIIYVTGKKKKGKSTSNAFAVSLYGNPRVLKSTWFGTKVGKEGLMYMYTDLPVWIDELETLGNDLDEAINTIYQYESGTGKVRGKKNQRNQPLRKFSGVLMITAEKDLDSVVKGVSNRRTAPNGTYRRVLEIKADENFFTPIGMHRGIPLHELNQFLQLNFGWFGQAWTQYVEQNMESIKLLNRENLKKAAVHGEMEGGFAIILTVTDILKDMRVVDAETHTLLQEYVLRLAKEHKDKNQHVDEVAFQFKQRLADFCNINRRNFIGLAYERERSGYVNYYGEVEQGNVFIMRTMFEKICQEHGFIPDQILKDLKKKGWLQCTRGYQKQMRYYNERPWGYYILDVFELEKPAGREMPEEAVPSIEEMVRM